MHKSQEMIDQNLKQKNILHTIIQEKIPQHIPVKLLQVSDMHITY